MVGRKLLTTLLIWLRAPWKNPEGGVVDCVSCCGAFSWFEPEKELMTLCMKLVRWVVVVVVSARLLMLAATCCVPVILIGENLDDLMVY